MPKLFENTGFTKSFRFNLDHEFLKTKNMKIGGLHFFLVFFKSVRVKRKNYSLLLL